MTITLPANSINLVARLFFLVLTFLLEYGFINFELRDPNIGDSIYLMYFLILLIGYLSLIIIVSLLSINKVQIDTTANSITFVSLFSKKTIATVDIDQYLDAIHSNPFKTFYGLLIKTNNNKTIQVAGQNIKSLSELKNYLNERKISYAGQKKMRFPFN